MDILDRGYWNYDADYSNILTFVHCGIRLNKPDEICGPSVRHMYLLHYIISGKGIYKVNNKTYNLKAGDVFAIFPDDVVSYQADLSDPWYFCWIGFSGSNADEYYKAIGIDYDNPVTNINNDIFIQGVINCLDYIDANNQTDLSELRLCAYVLEILSAFSIKNVNRQKSYIKKAIAYMEYNCENKINPKDVANHINLEYSYFYKLFKSEMCITPVEYLMHIRIEKAKKLLEADIEIKNIPQIVGISDVYYFSKLFKRYTGLTPLKYKMSINKE